MAGSLGLPVGLENVMHSLTKENCLESWEVMSHVQSDTTNVFIKFQKKTTRALPLVINDVSFQTCKIKSSVFLLTDLIFCDLQNWQHKQVAV